jgi:hypothetical protein
MTFLAQGSVAMAETGRLELTVVDVRGKAIPERVTIELRHQRLNDVRKAKDVSASAAIGIDGLHRDPQGLYELQVFASSYYPVGRFVTIPASGAAQVTMKMPIIADRAQGIFPPYDALDERIRGVLERSANVKSHEGLSGRALYDALLDPEKGGLLNIATKSFVTKFSNGGELLPHLTIDEIRGDRCFVSVPEALVDQMPTLVQDHAFHPVNGSLHHPPPGFTPAGSYKTFDPFGNLQLTFFKDGTGCVADVDIDDAAGLGHVFQVLRNTITKEPTHPYNIMQILLESQKLDPGYSLIPKA